MKKFFRILFLETLSLYLATNLTTGLFFANGLKTIIITGVALSLATFLIKPIVSLLILPLNLVTFGFFKWVSMAITLYLVDLVLPSFAIGNFTFHGFSTTLFSIPSFTLNGVLGLIAFSFLLSTLSSIGLSLID